MPWNCKACGAAVAEDSLTSCPSCEAAKSAWTVVEGRTRTMVLPRRTRVAFKRGASHASEAPLVPTERVPVTTRAELSACAAAQQPIPAAHLLTVELTPKPNRTPTVTLEVLPEEEEAAEHEVEVDDAPGPEGKVAARFAFVYGEGEVDAAAFPGVHLIPVDDGAGYAPAVEVRSSLARSPVTLEVGRCQLALAARDVAGQPLARWRVELSVEGAEPFEGVLDEEGRLTLDDVHHDRCQVRLLPPELEGEPEEGAPEEEPLRPEEDDGGYAPGDDPEEFSFRLREEEEEDEERA